MAACRRVHLILLLMSITACLFSTADQRQQNGNGNSRGILQPGGGGNLPGVSQSRRAAGWKLAEEEACREDLTRLCPKHTWNNNLAVLECLQDRKDVSWGLMRTYDGGNICSVGPGGWLQTQEAGKGGGWWRSWGGGCLGGVHTATADVDAAVSRG